MRIALVLLVLQAAARADSPPPSVWSAVKTPSGGPPRSIGRYSGGCLEGAVALPLSGDGFRVVEPGRGRFFGHPHLVSLIRELGAQVKKLRLGLLPVGDLAQARGGPAPTGHASHQTGLDVDIRYVPSGASMVDGKRKAPRPAFGAKLVRVLELAARDARVDRIFVNPVLKQALCERAGSRRDWLRKIRPWWGHADHYHVRLACPEDSPECERQPALPEGDGCADLAWWLKPDDSGERKKEHQAYSSKVGAAPELPERCHTLPVDEPPQTSRR